MNEVQVTIVPRFVAGKPNTDVLFLYRGIHYSSRYNYALADTPGARASEAAAFLNRRKRWP